MPLRTSNQIQEEWQHLWDMDTLVDVDDNHWFNFLSVGVCKPIEIEDHTKNMNLDKEYFRRRFLDAIDPILAKFIRAGKLDYNPPLRTKQKSLTGETLRDLPRLTPFHFSGTLDQIHRQEEFYRNFGYDV